MEKGRKFRREATQDQVSMYLLVACIQITRTAPPMFHLHVVEKPPPATIHSPCCTEKPVYLFNLYPRSTTLSNTRPIGPMVCRNVITPQASNEGSKAISYARPVIRQEGRIARFARRSSREGDTPLRKSCRQRGSRETGRVVLVTFSFDEWNEPPDIQRGFRKCR